MQALSDMTPVQQANFGHNSMFNSYLYAVCYQIDSLYDLLANAERGINKGRFDDWTPYDLRAYDHLNIELDVVVSTWDQF